MLFRARVVAALLMISGQYFTTALRSKTDFAFFLITESLILMSFEPITILQSSIAPRFWVKFYFYNIVQIYNTGSLVSLCCQNIFKACRHLLKNKGFRRLSNALYVWCMESQARLLMPSKPSRGILSLLQKTSLCHGGLPLALAKMVDSEAFKLLGTTDNVFCYPTFVLFCPYFCILIYVLYVDCAKYNQLTKYIMHGEEPSPIPSFLRESLLR